jgi:hypothetical protein
MTESDELSWVGKNVTLAYLSKHFSGIREYDNENSV